MVGNDVVRRVAYETLVDSSSSSSSLYSMSYECDGMVLRTRIEYDSLSSSSSSYSEYDNSKLGEKPNRRTMVALVIVLMLLSRSMYVCVCVKDV